MNTTTQQLNDRRVAREREIVRDLITTILDAGCSISVYDGEEFAIVRGTNLAEITEALFSTDSDTLFVRKRDDSQIGCIALIYGNGRDVISDYTDNEAIRALVEPVQERAEKEAVS